MYSICPVINDFKPCYDPILKGRIERAMSVGTIFSEDPTAKRRKLLTATAVLIAVNALVEWRRSEERRVGKECRL